MPVEPVPLSAYRSISGVEPFSGPEYWTGESVGLKVAVPFVAPVAPAVSVAGAMARPP